jgi:DNA repair exonuclease SbcCD ATPase subunit
MKEQIKERIQQLKAEYESGQKMLANLEAQESNLRTTMLRISGAIQILEELLSQAEVAGEQGSGGAGRD